MSDPKPESTKPHEAEVSPPLEFEERSITGSAQRLGIEPSNEFEPPSMALDALEPADQDE